MLSDFEKRQLDDEGYLVLPDLMSRELLHELRARIEELFAAEGAAAGSEFKQEPNARRLANLVNKGEVFERAILTPEVLECMEHVLGPEFKLSSLNVRVADPYSDCSQPCTPIAAPSPTNAATGSAIRSGCWTISPPKMAPSACCRDRTSGAGCRKTRWPTP